MLTIYTICCNIRRKRIFFLIDCIRGFRVILIINSDYFVITDILDTVHNRVRSRDSSIGTVTGYGLESRKVGVRVLVLVRFLSSPRRPERLWGSPKFLFNGTRGSFPGNKAVEA
jgi:hypothetical protein